MKISNLGKLSFLFFVSIFLFSDVMSFFRVGYFRCAYSNCKSPVRVLKNMYLFRSVRSNRLGLPMSKAMLSGGLLVGSYVSLSYLVNKNKESEMQESIKKQDAKKRTEQILDNLHEYSYSYTIIEDVLRLYPEAAELFSDKMAPILYIFDPLIIEKVIEIYPPAAKKFALEALKNLEKFRTIEVILKACPESASLFADRVAQCVERFHSRLIEDIISAYPESQATFEKALPKYPENEGTHSVQHYKSIHENSLNSCTKWGVDVGVMKQQFLPALQNEEKLSSKNLVSVYHGHRIEYDLLHLALDKALNAISRHTYGSSLRDLLNFLGKYQKLKDVSILIDAVKENLDFKKGRLLNHFYVQTPEKPLELLRNKEEFNEVMTRAQKQHEKMMNGRLSSEKNRNPKILSVNPFLFSNTYYSPSCTYQYVQNNENDGGILINWERDFLMPLGLSKAVYNKFTSRLIELQRKYGNCFDRGVLLQIAIPRDKLDDMVYLAKFGAIRTAYTLRCEESKKIKIDKFSDFLCHLDNKELPSRVLDRAELGIPLTEIGILNPFNVKIYRYMPNPIDEEMYRQVMKDLDELIEEIVTEVITEKNKLSPVVETPSLSCD